MTGADTNRVLVVIRSLDAWGESHDWVGPDPYEGMNARRPRIATANPYLRRAVIQAVKRSPLDLRPALAIEPRPSSAALAHVLSGYARMNRLGLLEEGGTAHRVDVLVRRLAALRCDGYDEPCWGYHFDVQTRFLSYGADTPNAIATAFAGLALLEAGAGRADGAEPSRMAEGVGEFFLRHVPQTRNGAGAYFGYLPGDRSPIHNANLLVCSLLAKLAARTRREDFRNAATAGLRYAVAHQHTDGSWPYAEGPQGSWVDGCHTGYVLDALRVVALCLGDDEALNTYRSGLTYYAANLFEAGGVPKFFSDGRYPIASQCAAQGIRTFALAAADDPAWLERALAIFAYAVRHLRRADGAFVFERRRFWTNRIPHVRWVQAPMLEALTVLYEASRAADERSAEEIPG